MPKLYESKVWLQRQHHTNKKSLKEIADMCGVDERTIRRKMEKHRLRIINWRYLTNSYGIVIISNMTDEIAEYNVMDRVVELKLKGRSDYQVAKELKLKRVEVINIMNEWYRSVRSAETKDRAQSRLAEFEESTQMQVQELWENVEDLKANNEYKSVAAAVKAINDIEHRRFDALQKAGLIDDAELGDMLAQQQEQAVQLEELLRELSDVFPETKSWLLPRLRRIFRPDELPEPDIIEGDVVE